MTPIVRRFGAPGASVEVILARHRACRFTPHSHAEYAIGTAVSGKHLLHVGGKRRVVHAGDFIVLPPETAHAVESMPHRSWSVLMFHVPASVIERDIASDTMWRGHSGRFVHNDASASADLRQIGDDVLFTRQDIDLPAALRCFAERWLEPAASARGCDDEAVDALIRHLEDLSIRPAVLQQTGAEFGLSVFQLIRRFRAVVGMTPMAYRIQWRARLGRQVLFETGHISLAAGRAGYADQSHLTRHFRRVFGMTPGAYVRSINCDRTLVPVRGGSSRRSGSQIVVRA